MLSIDDVPVPPCALCGATAPADQMGHIWRPSGLTPQQLAALVRQALHGYTPVELLTHGNDIIDTVLYENRGRHHAVCQACCDGLLHAGAALHRWVAPPAPGRPAHDEGN
jgi:hypothetical protein